MKAGPIPLTLDELRLIGQWASDCAERVLPLFQSAQTSDTRPQEAIEGVRLFAQGGKRVAQLRSQSLAALAAAREVDHPAAQAAARSACMAASSAYTHPLASVEQARHILAPAVYAALACGQSDDANASDEELKWAVQHAPPTVREVLQRYPAQNQGETRLASLYHQLDVALRR